MSSYEFPFNERIRTLLRLEDLFGKLHHNIAKSLAQEHHCAMMFMLQILDVIDRAELKADLIQELERQKNNMLGLRGNPQISEKALNDILDKIDATSTALKSDNGKLGQTLRDNEWLMSIKQRAGIPGGVCAFDLPSYHHWLNLDAARRKQDFALWLTKLNPIHDAAGTILKILRGSGARTKYLANNGFFQQMLAGAKPAQMLRIELPDRCPCFPEVSANKYAINIRFFGLDSIEKTKKCEEEIDFTMVLCNL
ncbi:MAG: cell division protein ZapD [Methylophilaceae bacterium]|nr:cell division protein ZapD [Methylophilaceae bacterium]